MAMTEMMQEETPQEVPAYTAGTEEANQGQQVDPKTKREVEGFTSVLINIMHSEKTRDAVLDMLGGPVKKEGEDPNAAGMPPGQPQGQAGMPLGQPPGPAGEQPQGAAGEPQQREADPYMSVPAAAVAVNDMAVGFMKDAGKDIGFGTQLAGSATIISDLIQLGYATKMWEELSKEDIAAIYEDTLQIVIERGLADGSIDPIQLQADVEPLMDENQRGLGNALGADKGLASEPSQQAMTEQYAQGKVRKGQAKTSKDNAQKKQQALGGQ